MIDVIVVVDVIDVIFNEIVVTVAPSLPSKQRYLPLLDPGAKPIFRSPPHNLGRGGWLLEPLGQ